MKLHGIEAPAGEGIVLEVHVDLQRTTPEFNDWLVNLGFEDDPFATFYPAGYVGHMTGRLRVPPKNLRALLPDVNALAASVIQEGASRNLSLYIEVELVHAVCRFTEQPRRPFERILDGFCFSRSGRFGAAKSDVHVEFPNSKVPQVVREYLLEKEFYWVSTPATSHFPAEEIATLQTATYESGKCVYELLAAHLLPNCTAIHLEQKLSMITTNFNLAMPEVIDVRHCEKKD